MQFLVAALRKTSFIDFPEKISAVVFTQGCNFRCAYCHNPDLLAKNSKNETLSIEEVFEFLEKRRGKLDAVVISGAEATLQPDLGKFIERVKNMGFLIKLDTNGSNPEVIQELINNNLLDYIAMDIKAPYDKYALITNVEIDAFKIKKSIDIIMKTDFDYEFRTTVVASQLNFQDFEKIAQMIKGAKNYWLQKFVAAPNMYDNTFQNAKTYSDEEFKVIMDMLKKHINFVGLR